jgi:hypothetical protein
VLLLTLGTGHLLRVITSVGGSDLEPNISYVDKTAGTGGFQYDYAGAGDALPSITTATTTTLLAGAASTQRAVESVTLYNNHATVTETYEIVIEDGTHTSSVCSGSLAPGEMLEFNGSEWLHKDANTGTYVAVGPMATQAEMEAGASLITVVSPGRLHYHPAATKAWGKAVGAGTSLTVNYNITSVSDTGTGRLGVNIATDFSSANYSINATLERSVTALTATGVEDNQIRNASPAVGSFEIESYDQTAITFVAQDPTSYFWKCSGDQ